MISSLTEATPARISATPLPISVAFLGSIMEAIFLENNTIAITYILVGFIISKSVATPFHIWSGSLLFVSQFQKLPYSGKFASLSLTFIISSVTAAMPARSSATSLPIWVAFLGSMIEARNLEKLTTEIT